MRSKMWFPVLVTLLAAMSCSRILEPNERSTGIIIAYGTSFGECLGYCRTELILSDQSATLTLSSWDKQNFPNKSIEESLTDSEWSKIQQAASLDHLKTLPDIIGCPDCADGGAEWIEIRNENKSKKVIFEYGDTLAGFEDMLNQLRELHEKLQKKL